MGVFDTAYEKLSGLTGKSLKSSEAIILNMFNEFCEINKIGRKAMFLAIIEDKIQIVVLSDILGPQIGFITATDN